MEAACALMLLYSVRPSHGQAEVVAVLSIEKANVAPNRLLLEGRLEELAVVDEVHMVADSHRCVQGSSPHVARSSTQTTLDRCLSSLHYLHASGRCACRHRLLRIHFQVTFSLCRGASLEMLLTKLRSCPEAKCRWWRCRPPCQGWTPWPTGWTPRCS